MALGLGYMGADAALKNYADWTDRIAAASCPMPSPRGRRALERNMVVTMWDFSTPKYYLHDGNLRPTATTPGSTQTARSTARPRESTDMVPALDR